MQEVCGDGIDNDCDDLVDDDGAGGRDFYPDSDNDGYGVDAPVSACSRPEGFVESLDVGIDCDDGEPSVYPGAVETWYDGVDQDCDGSDDYDRDGDGFRSADHGGEDCADDLPTVNPDATEACGNHVDDDCDGTHNGCAWSGSLEFADVRIASLFVPADDDIFMTVSVGDTNADGFADLTANGEASGEWFVVHGPIAGLQRLDDAAAIHVEVLTSGSFTADIGGDLTDDGKSDLLLFRGVDSGPGDVYAFAAPLHPETAESDATNKAVGPDDVQMIEFTSGPTGGYVGDLDQDGTDAFYAVEPRMDPPTCFLVEGLPFFPKLEDAAWLEIEDCTFVALGPDVDGDGTHEVAVPRGEDLHLVDGSTTGTATDSDVLLTLPFEIGSTLKPDWSLFHDLDGDGSQDLAGTVESSGNLVIHVLFGPFSAATTAPPQFRVTPESGGPVALLGAARSGDFDGDGSADLVSTGVVSDGATGTLLSRLYVFFGPLAAGEVSAASADAIIEAPEGSFLGAPLVADIDGDGYDDIVASDLNLVHILYGQGR